MIWSFHGDYVLSGYQPCQVKGDKTNVSKTISPHPHDTNVTGDPVRVMYPENEGRDGSRNYVYFPSPSNHRTRLVARENFIADIICEQLLHVPLYSQTFSRFLNITKLM